MEEKRRYKINCKWQRFYVRKMTLKIRYYQYLRELRGSFVWDEDRPGEGQRHRDKIKDKVKT